MAKWKLSEKAIKEQLAKAKERTRLQDEIEPRATAVHYEQGSNRIVVELSNGADFRFAPSSVQELIGASPDEIAQVELSPSGRTLRWKKLDADLSLPGLMVGIFGTKMWMAHLGREGGQATSQAKAAAARLNGLKGGRPKKVIDVDRIPARAGTWKTKGVHTSPTRRLTDKPAKSPRSVKSSVLTERDKTNTKSHVRSDARLSKAGRFSTRISVGKSKSKKK